LILNQKPTFLFSVKPIPTGFWVRFDFWIRDRNPDQALAPPPSSIKAGQAREVLDEALSTAESLRGETMERFVLVMMPQHQWGGEDAEEGHGRTGAAVPV
jgi:hypothetical protein